MTDVTNKGAEAWRWEYDRSGRMVAESAEKILLGTLLVHFEKHSPNLGDLEKADFAVEFHAAAFQAMRDIFDEGFPVNAVSVAERLEERSQLGLHAGGISYLLELMDQSESRGGDHLVEWVETLRRNAALVKFKRDISELSKIAELSPDLDALQSKAAAMAESLPGKRRRRETTLADATFDLLEDIKLGVPDTFKWGIPDIDDAIGGVAPGELIILGGRPSQGKSAVALQWLDNASMHGIPGMLISEEMPSKSIAKRQLKRIAPIELRSDDERINFEVRQHFADRAPVIITESVQKIATVERAVENAIDKHGVKIVAVDYVQLLQGDGKSRYEQVSDVSTRLKRIATKHQIVVLMLAQLNRDSEKKQDGPPQMSDLKDSGQLEQDADVILFQFWPIKVDPTYPDHREYRVFQCKNRNRGISTAIITLDFDAERQRFSSRSAIPDGIDERF